MAPNRPSQIPLPGRSSPPPVDAQEPTTPRPTAPSASSGSYPFAPPTQSLFTKRRESQSELEAPVAIKIDIPGPPRLLAREFAKSIANSSTSTPQPSNASSKGNLAADGGLLPATMTTALNAAAASNSSGRMARSSTITKNSSGGSNSSAKRSGSKQPPIRKDSEAGYEGGMERHGQANDFVDEPEDEDSHDESTPPSANTSAKHTRNDSPPVSATSMKSSASSNNGGAKFPDLSDSYHRNRNPSASAHHHPSKLPLHSRRTQNPRDLYKTKGRTASVSSTRSTEAQMHPFPTPGMNNDPAGKEDGLFDEWKSVEETRLDEDERKEKHWKRWGPYVSERQWATVREDYSANGDAWTHFPHEHARSRAYRWGEDGLGGISDNHGKMCFAVGLWNGVDPILKERMFGVTGHQGNHGEDVKELYYYLDSTPTHSYMKYLYKYPQREYPYDALVRESSNRSRDVGEFEITDTDAFDDDKYWDVFVEYAKDEDDADATSIRITVYNRGPDAATLHVIPQLWFRNTWSWPKDRPTGKAMPSVQEISEGVIQADQEDLGRYYLHCNSSPAPVDPRVDNSDDDDEAAVTEEVVVPELMFTDNDTNFERLYGGTNVVPYVKDAFHDHIIPGHRPAVPSHVDAPSEESYESDSTTGTSTPQPPPRQFVNPEKKGTKAGAHYIFKDVPGNGGCAVVRLKLCKKTAQEDPAATDEESFDCVVEERRMDSDEFYSRFNSGALSDDLRNIMRQALSGMLWTKQFYMFIQKEWIEGDPGQPPPPPERKHIRNQDWKHMHIEDILSMPDKWEYPFFAIWDSAFHCLPLAMIDPAYAKKQLDIMTREWYMKPDGALPAYEWNFSDVNPPVHAWATFRVFKIERKMHGRQDLQFLERVFQKLMINFTWWVNRKDEGGNNVFEGGFLGLDNISPFNRSEKLPTGGTMRQADGTGWMAFYCLSMLNIALELAKHNPVYEDIASKFFEHFLFISDAMTFQDGSKNEVSLWNDEEGFYFDAIVYGPDDVKQLPVRSLVGLIPLFATLTLEPSTIKKFPGFKKRMEWFISNRSVISKRNIANMSLGGKGDRRLLALANEDRLKRILERMLDEEEFLSDYGIRSLSRYHKDNPWSMDVNGEEFSVHYWPGDSHSSMFGGNSNWRGPIWLATTFLLIESLQRFYQYHGNNFKIECPTGSGDMMNLANVADELQHRVIHLFARDYEGNRAIHGGSEKLNKDPHFRDYVPFHEFFHADSGKGLGASHQTGWTGLVAMMIWQTGSSARLPRTPRTPRSAAAHYFDEVPPTPGGSEWEGSEGVAWGELSTGEITCDDL